MNFSSSSRGAVSRAPRTRMHPGRLRGASRALLFCLALGLGAVVVAQDSQASVATASGLRTNLDHLRFLTDVFEVEGEQHLGVWIYAEPSPTVPGAYEPRDVAAEGATDIDDVARAAIAYLWWHRDHRSEPGGEEALDLARGLLEFTMAMQAEDGEFYNFVFSDGQINRLGITSRKGAGFWAARALWALAEGIAVFEDVDPDFTARLRAAFLAGLPPFEAKIAAEYGNFAERHGFTAPAWLPDNGADVASNLLLGLAVFLQGEEHEQARRLQVMVAEGLTTFQYGPAGSYPFLAHPSFARDPLDWHAWGSRQTQALARAAQAGEGTAAGAAAVSGATADTLVADPASYLRSAEAEAAHFFVHLLVDRGPYSNMNPAVRVYPQIAYGMEAIASGYFALADATDKVVYDELGGLMTSWLLGNNSLHQAMYDPETGRVYDGLERGVINRNAGAESTITGIMALSQAEARPAAEAMLDLMWLDSHSEFSVEAETGSDFGEAPPTEVDGTASGQLAAVLRPGASLSLTADVPRAGSYLVYALFRDEPWEARANVFIGRELLGAAVSDGSAVESRFHMSELGTVRLEAGATSLTISHAGGRDLRFDALLFRPAVTWKLYGEEGRRLLLLKSWAPDQTHIELPLEVPAVAEVRVFDATATTSYQGAPQAETSLPPYGFGIITWPSDEPLPMLAQAQAREGPLVPVTAAFEAGNLVALDLTPLFTSDAFSLSSRPQRGNFDNRSGVYGATYPAERAPAASSRFEAGGVEFLFPPTDSEANNVALLGQRVEVPAGRYAAVHLLGSSEQGNYQAPLLAVYEDGSEELPLGLSDWCQLPRYGESVAVEFAQRRGASGAVERITCRIFMQSLELDESRTLVRLELPDRETMHLFAITLESATRDQEGP